MPSHLPNRDPARTFARLAARSVAASLLFALASYWPAKVALGGEPAVLAMLLATGVALLGSLAASAAPAAYVRRAPKELAFAVLASFGVRFLVTMGAALVAMPLRIVPPDALLVWVAVAQLALLAADSAALIALARAAGTEAKC